MNPPLATFRIDTQRSVVTIDAKSNVHPIHQESRGLTGLVEADVRDGQLVGAPTAMEVSLAADGLDADNALETRELKRRLEVQKYPTISGRATQVAADGRTLHVTGDVTFRGATRQVSGDVTVTVPDDDTLQLEGAATFDIRDWGMDPPRILLFKVQPDVAISIRVVALRAE